MNSANCTVLLALASSLLFLNCMPDFNALSAETGSAGQPAAGAPTDSGGALSSAGSGGDSFGGSAVGGGVTAGTGGELADFNAGSGNVSGAGAVSAGAGTSGTGADGGAGAGGGAAAGGAGAGGGGAGMGGAPTCRTSPVGATVYSTFDHGDILGPGFVDATSGTKMDTTTGATGSWAWDAAVGNRCPGALRFTFAFSEYVSGNPYEVGAGYYYFGSADWSNWSALHVMVKVSPSNAPLSSVRLFVISGSQYLYRATTDASNFKTGEWNDTVVPLPAGSNYDPTSVGQLGVQAALDPAGTSGIPATPPTVNIWLDDIWLEPK